MHKDLDRMVENISMFYSKVVCLYRQMKTTKIFNSIAILLAKVQKDVKKKL
jgi:hypothetical protein